jgi:hypothetical protein
LPEVLFMAYWDGERWVDQQTRAPRQVSKARRLFSHSWQAVLEGALVSLLVVGLVAGTAFAGKGGRNAAAPSLDLVMVADANTNGAPNYGDTITFRSNTTATNAEVGLRCYQGSTFVFDGYVSLYDSWMGRDLTLVSSQWNASASADCYARLFTYNRKGQQVVMTTLGVPVAP